MSFGGKAFRAAFLFWERRKQAVKTGFPFLPRFPVSLFPIPLVPEVGTQNMLTSEKKNKKPTYCKQKTGRELVSFTSFQKDTDERLTIEPPLLAFLLVFFGSFGVASVLEKRKT